MSGTDPVLTIESSFDPSTLDKVSFSRKTTDDNGVSTSIKCEIPIITSKDGNEAFLYFLVQFDHARAALQWEDGNDLARSFRACLQGSWRDDWDDFYNEQVDNEGNNKDHNEEWFDAIKQDLINDVFEISAWRDMQDYLRRVKKPVDMSPVDLYKKTRHLEALTLKLPDAPEQLFDEEERKRNYFNALPMKYRNKFDEANMTLEEETYMNMRKYFKKIYANEQKEKKREQTNKEKNKNKNNNNSGGGRNNNSNGNRNNRGGRGNHRGRGNRGSDSNNNGNSNRIRDTDTCPLPGHHNHKWGDCFQNAGNPNRNNRPTGRSGNSNNVSRRESHNNDNNNGPDQHRESNPQGGESNSNDRRGGRIPGTRGRYGTVRRQRRVRFESDSEGDEYESYHIDSDASFDKGYT